MCKKTYSSGNKRMFMCRIKCEPSSDFMSNCSGKLESYSNRFYFTDLKTFNLEYKVVKFVGYISSDLELNLRCNDLKNYENNLPDAESKMPATLSAIDSFLKYHSFTLLESNLNPNEQNTNPINYLITYGKIVEEEQEKTDFVTKYDVDGKFIFAESK